MLNAVSISRLCGVVAVVALWAMAGVSTAVAQAPGSQEAAASLDSRLPSLTGLERARALAKLVDAHKLDQPGDALRYGAEALRLFATYPDPAAHVATLSELLWPHMSAGRYDSAAFYADSARRFAHRVGDRAGEARAISNLGTLAQRMGDPNRAVDDFTQALALQRATGNDREIANSLNNLGFVYSTDLADYAKSLADHLEALSIRERLGDKAGIALSLNNIGIVYARLREYDNALAQYARALELRRELGNKTRIAATLNNIGDAYLAKGDLSKAMSYQQQALELRVALADRSAIALSHRNIGLVYLGQHDLTDAHRELLEAKRVAVDVGDKGLVVQVRLGLAAYERAHGAPAAAVAYARDALATADSMASREMIRQAATELAIAQESQGELTEALEEFRRSKAVSDSIYNAETARRISSLEAKFSEERRLHELEVMRGAQAELRAQASERAVQRNGAAAIALIAVIVGFFLYRRRIERATLAESLSVTDSLTGLRNRRYLQQTIDMDVAASLRRTRSAALVGTPPTDADLVFFMLDVDYFKSVNDANGHAAGDQLLVQIGTVLRDVCRDSDVIVRWGGDEFLIIARFADRYVSALTAERLRQGVERHAMTLPDGRPIRVTCSIGFAAFPFDPREPDGTSWEEVVAMADQAAYSAKRNGRNRWAAADPSYATLRTSI